MSYSQIDSPQMRQALEDASNEEGFLTLADFVQIALYHPQFGYYTSQRERVGKTEQSDFFTATTFRETFAPAVLEASLSLLDKAGIAPQNTIFTEIGAEPDAALLRDCDHPFKTTETVRIGQSAQFDGNRILFSNELFDAQPFQSVLFTEGKWRERVVEVSENGLRFAHRTPFSSDILKVLPDLPIPAPEGYTIDLPTQTAPLLASHLEQNWKGVFIAFDYGKTWQALTHDFPYGTARAYSQHRQKPQLLDDPGQQDLTLHICWEWLEETLAAHSFREIQLLSQEGFFVHKAPQLLQKAFAPENGPLSKIRSQLRQLIHPSLMGQKFQALIGIRT